MIGRDHDVMALPGYGAELRPAEVIAEGKRSQLTPGQHRGVAVLPRWISRCSTFVPMVETADLRNGDDFAGGGLVVGGDIGRVFGQSLSSAIRVRDL
jgi:hypothetical protein